MREQALVEFNFNFSEYVKNMDIDIWNKAVDFAATMTNYPGVEFGRPGSTG